MSKKKGASYERKIMHLHQDHGIVCHRVPLSGAMEGYPGDLVINEDLVGEVKARKDGRGFKEVESWLEGADFLFLYRIRLNGERTDGKPLVVMSWDKYVEFMHKADELRRLKDE